MRFLDRISGSEFVAIMRQLPGVCTARQGGMLEKLRNSGSINTDEHETFVRLVNDPKRDSIKDNLVPRAERKAGLLFTWAIDQHQTALRTIVS
jgi:hypothetical protein